MRSLRKQLVGLNRGFHPVWRFYRWRGVVAVQRRGLGEECKGGRGELTPERRVARDCRDARAGCCLRASRRRAPEEPVGRVVCGHETHGPLVETLAELKASAGRSVPLPQ